MQSHDLHAKALVAFGRVGLLGLLGCLGGGARGRYRGRAGAAVPARRPVERGWCGCLHWVGRHQQSELRCRQSGISGGDRCVPLAGTTARLPCLAGFWPRALRDQGERRSLRALRTTGGNRQQRKSVPSPSPEPTFAWCKSSSESGSRVRTWTSRPADSSNSVVVTSNASSAFWTKSAPTRPPDFPDYRWPCGK